MKSAEQVMIHDRADVHSNNSCLQTPANQRNSKTQNEIAQLPTAHSQTRQCRTLQPFKQDWDYHLLRPRTYNVMFFLSLSIPSHQITILLQFSYTPFICIWFYPKDKQPNILIRYIIQNIELFTYTIVPALHLNVNSQKNTF
jgi:hypothetical protein